PFFNNEDQAVEVGAQFSTELSAAQMMFFQQISQFDEVCGEDAIFAYSSAILMHKNQTNLICLNDLINEASNQAQNNVLNQLTDSYLSQLHYLDELQVAPPVI